MNFLKPWMVVAACGLLVGFILMIKQSSRSTQAPPDLSSVGRAAISSRTSPSKLVKLVVLDKTNIEASPLMSSAREASAVFPALILDYVDVSKHASATQALGLAEVPALLFVNAAGQVASSNPRWMSPEEIRAKCKEFGLLPVAKPSGQAKDVQATDPLPGH